MIGDIVSVKVRRLLYLCSVLFIILAVGIRLWLGVNPAGRGVIVARELAASVAGAVIVWMLSIVFMGVFLKNEQRAREAQVFDSDRSSKEFSKSVRETSSWRHHGHIGRWVRENVIPEFVQRAKMSPAQFDVEIILLDVRNNDACQSHAARRNARRRKESSAYTAGSIKAEIAATAIILARACISTPNLSAVLFVSDLENPFRLDLSDSFGFVTHEDQTAPAFGFESESPYYATARNYFASYSTAGAREIDLSAAPPIDSHIDESVVRDILVRMDLDFPELDRKAVRKMVADFVGRGGV